MCVRVSFGVGGCETTKMILLKMKQTKLDEVVGDEEPKEQHRDDDCALSHELERRS